MHSLPRSPLPILAVLVAMLVSLAACNRHEQHPVDVIATVGTRTVTIEEFKSYLGRNAGTELAQIAPEASSALLDQYLEEIVLSEYAALRGIDFPADKVAAAVRSDAGSSVAGKRDELRRSRLIDQTAGEIPEPTVDEVRSYYENSRDEFRFNERIRLRQILVHDAGTASRIADELRRGAAFEELSARYSVAPNAPQGGDIGYVSRGQVPKIFEEEIFALAPGETTSVIRADNSFHIFKVDEHQAAGLAPFEQAEPVIRAKLRGDALDAAVTRMIADARKEIAVRVLSRRLPFAYSGSFPISKDE